MADKTILIADDSDLVIRSLKRCLSRGGYDVIEVNDASAAIAVLQDESKSVDMILSDNNMGEGITGLEFAALVRGFANVNHPLYEGKNVPESYRNIPFALVTGGGNMADKADYAKRLDIEFIEKPFDGSALLSMIGTYLD